jgi:thioesterase domain-containing protein
VLGLNRVGARDSFFDLGGDSTLAVGLVARARQQGLRLSTRVVFESPILAEMAARTRGASGRVAGSWRPEVWRNRVSLVHLNAGPPSRTVFCIHEIGGNVTAYAEVAARLAAAAHLIGVEAGSAGLGREPGRDLLAMARTYAEAIRDIQPVGPYRLIGYSLGGAIAHAIAALMEAGGGSVELLAVVDSVLPVGPLTDTLRRYADRIDALAALPPGGLAKARPLARRLDLPEVVLTLPPDDLARRLHTMAAHTVALLTYRPIPIRSEVLLYQAGRSRWAMPLAEAWAPYCGRVDARTGPGDHLSIMRPPAIDGIADDLWAVLRLDPGAAGRR